MQARRRLTSRLVSTPKRFCSSASLVDLHASPNATLRGKRLSKGFWHDPKFQLAFFEKLGAILGIKEVLRNGALCMC